MAGFDNDVVYASNVDFTGSATVTGQFTTNGQLLIGSTAAPYARVGSLTSTGATVTISTGAGTINLEAGAAVPTTFTADAGSATPALNNLTIAGGSNGIDTSASGSTVTLNFDVAETGCITTVNGDSGSATATANAISIVGAGTVSTSSSGSTVTITGSASGSNSTNAYYIIDEVDDCITVAADATSTSTGRSGYINVVAQGTGAGINDNIGVTSGRPGVFYMNTGTTNSGNVACGRSLASGATNRVGGIILGGGEVTLQWFTLLNQLSNVTETFTYNIGIAYDSLANAFTDGVFFSYTHSVNSGKWVINSIKSSAATTANTNSTVDTNWHAYKIVVNAAATSVSFYIDGVQVTGSPLATNIPNTKAIVPVVSMVKSVGTSRVYSTIDLYTLHIELTTPR